MSHISKPFQSESVTPSPPGQAHLNSVSILFYIHPSRPARQGPINISKSISNTGFQHSLVHQQAWQHQPRELLISLQRLPQLSSLFFLSIYYNNQLKAARRPHPNPKLTVCPGDNRHRCLHATPFCSTATATSSLVERVGGCAPEPYFSSARRTSRLDSIPSIARAARSGVGILLSASTSTFRSRSSSRGGSGGAAGGAPSQPEPPDLEVFEVSTCAGSEDRRRFTRR